MADPRKFGEPLADDLAAALLAEKSDSPVPPKDGEADDPSIWHRLEAAKQELADAVEEANLALGTSPLTKLVAREVMLQQNRRGQATVEVDATGTPLLLISSSQDEDRPLRKWSSDLPPMEELRERAAAVKLDISKYGRRRKDIKVAVEEAEAAEARKADEPPAPRKKRMKTGDAISPPVVVHDPEAPQAEVIPFPAPAEPPMPIPFPAPTVMADPGPEPVYGPSEPTEPDPQVLAALDPEPTPVFDDDGLDALLDGLDERLPPEPAEPPNGKRKGMGGLKALLDQSRNVDLDGILKRDPACPPEDPDDTQDAP